MTTLYFVGNGSCVWTPKTTTTVAIDTFGAGQAGDTSANAGNGGSYAHKNSQSVTAGTPVALNLGAPGLSGGTAGGNTWAVSSSTVLAPGGGSSTTAIGDTTFAGGVGTPNSANAGGAAGGGGGCAGPHGIGQNGGNAISLSSGGAGGGANGGGAGGNDAVPGPAGGNGGNGYMGLGGAGGTSSGAPNGANGGAGSGGGGGYGDGTTGGNGGSGGDDYDNGGGGGASGGESSTGLGNGGNGGTPGGGGGPGYFTVGTPGRGGYGLVKFTYSSSDPDQIFLVGGITLAQIPASWTRNAIAEGWGPGGNGAAGTASSAGGGGGSGGYSRVNTLTITAGSTLGVVVGAGSTASSIGTTLVANAGGNASGATQGAAASSGSGDTTSPGAIGGNGVATAAGGGGGGAGASGNSGTGMAGANGTAGGVGGGGGGSNFDPFSTAFGTAFGPGPGGVGGVNNGTATTGPGANGISDSRGGSGGGGGGHNTTAANAAGGSGGWPGGAGGGGGAGSASNGGLGAAGLLILTRIAAATYSQTIPLLLSETITYTRRTSVIRSMLSVETFLPIKQARTTVAFIGPLAQILTAIKGPVKFQTAPVPVIVEILQLVKQPIKPSYLSLNELLATSRNIGKVVATVIIPIITLPNFIYRITRVVEPQLLVALENASGKTVSFIQSYALAAIKQTTPRSIFIFNYPIVQVLKGVSYPLAIPVVTTLIYAASRVYNRAATFLSPQILTVIKRVNKLLAATMAELINVRRSVSHLLATSVASVIRLTKAVSLHVTEILTQNLRLTRQFVRSAMIILGSNVSVLRQIVRRILLLALQVFTERMQRPSRNSFVVSEALTAMTLVSRVGTLIAVALQTALQVTKSAGKISRLQLALTFNKAVTAGRRAVFAVTQNFSFTQFHNPIYRIASVQTVSMVKAVSKHSRLLTPLVFSAVKLISRLIAVSVQTVLLSVGRAKIDPAINLTLQTVLSWFTRAKYDRKVKGAALPSFTRGAKLPPPMGEVE